MDHKIPQQRDGRKMDALESINFSNLEEAKRFYTIARHRLLHINNWYDLAKLPIATFSYLDKNGQASLGHPKIGGYLKINIPGPGLPSTAGYDYVRIENIEETDDENLQILTITLRPSSNPLINDPEHIQHFFKEMATSTLQVQRINKNVNAFYYGRNEVINLDVDSLSDKIRNLFIGIGAKLGASFPQWKSLLKGIMDTNPRQGDYQAR